MKSWELKLGLYFSLLTWRAQFYFKKKKALLGTYQPPEQSNHIASDRPTYSSCDLISRHQLSKCTWRRELVRLDALCGSLREGEAPIPTAWSSPLSRSHISWTSLALGREVLSPQEWCPVSVGHASAPTPASAIWDHSPCMQTAKQLPLWGHLSVTFLWPRKMWHRIWCPMWWLVRSSLHWGEWIDYSNDFGKNVTHLLEVLLAKEQQHNHGTHFNSARGQAWDHAEGKSTEIQVGFLLKVVVKKKKTLSEKYKRKHIHFSSHPKKTVNSYRGRFMNTLSVTEDFRDAGVAELDWAIPSVISVCVWEGVSGEASHMGQWAEKSHFDVVSLHLSSWRPRLSKRPWGGRCILSLRTGHASSGTGHQDSKVTGLSCLRLALVSSPQPGPQHLTRAPESLDLSVWGLH